MRRQSLVRSLLVLATVAVLIACTDPTESASRSADPTTPAPTAAPSAAAAAVPPATTRDLTAERLARWAHLVWWVQISQA